MATWSSSNNASVLTERRALLDARLALANGGSLRLYSSAPALLATCALSATAFGAADGSCLATANAVSPDVAPTTGTAIASAKILKSDGTTEVITLTVGLGGSGADVIIAGATLTPPSGSVIVVNSITVQG